jgi:hypothetical protein
MKLSSASYTLTPRSTGVSGYWLVLATEYDASAM